MKFRIMQAFYKAVACTVYIFCIFTTKIVDLSVSDVYSYTWAVHVTGGSHVAKQLANDHGFVYVSQIMPDYYLLRHNRVARRSVAPRNEFHHGLVNDSRVAWAEQQKIKRRVKRDAISFNDPKWPKLWYMILGLKALKSEELGHHDLLIMNRGSGLDMNVIEAYSVWKATGKGIVVTILDDGIEKDHPDILKNYDADASYDVNAHDNDPTPRYDDTNENRHGTRCAGEVAAEANNGICGVGIAYEAGIGGVRMLDGDVTDAVEAQSISLNPQHIHIYSASWGPDDDGRTVDGPGPLARKAFMDGIKHGRGGLGSIYVWASGNGGQQGDSCNCDGYTNSMYTLSISSASENGNVPWYSEACSSTLAATYSSGQGSERQIITTDLRKRCTENHTGTSASAPLAAGICALVLQANPSLTWRDLQHIVVLTAKRANLQANDWVTNGANLSVSHHFGFGLMDAAAMVDLAKVWKSVPPQIRCTAVHSSFEARNVPQNGFIESEIISDGCAGSESEIRYLEHVEAVVTLSSSVRGRVQISLTSPSGTKSTLLATRSRDTSTDGFNQWPFMTTHSWYESPKGKWTLQVQNGASIAVLKNWTLVMFGTLYRPQTSTRQGNSNPRSTGACAEGQYYMRPYCYPECPVNFYAENITANSSESLDNGTSILAVCKNCDSTCARCTGPERTQCTACPLHHLLHLNTCVPLTPTYENSVPTVFELKKILLFVVLSLSCLFVTALLVYACLVYPISCNGLSAFEKPELSLSAQRPLLDKMDDEDEVGSDLLPINGKTNNTDNGLDYETPEYWQNSENAVHGNSNNIHS